MRIMPPAIIALIATHGTSATSRIAICRMRRTHTQFGQPPDRTSLTKTPPSFGRQRRLGRRSAVTPLRVNRGADRPHRLPLHLHLHHVTRDPGADVSAKAHRVELDATICKDPSNIAVKIRSVARRHAAAEARYVLEHVVVSDGVPIHLLDVGPESRELLRPLVLSGPREQRTKRIQRPRRL